MRHYSRLESIVKLNSSSNGYESFTALDQSFPVSVIR